MVGSSVACPRFEPAAGKARGGPMARTKAGPFRVRLIAGGTGTDASLLDRSKKFVSRHVVMVNRSWRVPQAAPPADAMPQSHMPPLPLFAKSIAGGKFWATKSSELVDGPLRVAPDVADLA